MTKEALRLLGLKPTRQTPIEPPIGIGNEKRSWLFKSPQASAFKIFESKNLVIAQLLRRRPNRPSRNCLRI